MLDEWPDSGCIALVVEFISEFRVKIDRCLTLWAASNPANEFSGIVQTRGRPVFGFENLHL